jgi:HSP20 family protein
MEDVSSFHLRRLHGRLGEVIYELTRMQFTKFVVPEPWHPAINAYRCEAQIVVCVDLAGVEREGLELRVEPRRLSLQGRRKLPEPAEKEPRPVQVLAMEIDYGPFERQVELPAPVDPQRVTAEQRNGLLWIYLPLLSQS